MVTKAEVTKQIEGLIQQEKQFWANLNYCLGQKSILEALLAELPDDPPAEELPPVMGTMDAEVPMVQAEVPDNVIPFKPRPKKDK